MLGIAGISSAVNNRKNFATIDVHDNAAKDSFWDAIGFSFDFSDNIHKMNPFDASRVEIKNLSGIVKFINK